MYKPNKLVEKELSEKPKQNDVTSLIETFFHTFIISQMVYMSDVNILGLIKEKLP